MPEDEVPIAPAWHTAALVALIVVVAATGALLGHRAASAPAASADPASWARLLAIYLPLLAVQAFLLVYVCRIGRPRSALGALLGRRWTSWSRALSDLSIALSTWAFIQLCERGWSRAIGATSSAAVVAMLPRSLAERIAWVLVSLCVGFTEEVVYRGYLQTQLTAFTRRAPLAVLIQAVLFGVAHGEQGPGAVVRLTVYGLAFGVIARARRSLLPGIVGHVWTNVASGLLRL